MMTEFRLDNLSAGYGNKPVLSELSLLIPAGRITAIVGANGCGKSTLLRCLAGLHRPGAGHIWLDDEPLPRMPPSELARRVGFLPQFPSAPSGLRVEELVALGRHPHRKWLRQWSDEDADSVREALILTDLTELAGQPLDVLSGGQRQRAWMAMLLAQATPVLLLDEPGSMLDPGHQLELFALLRVLADAGRTVVVVMHDLVAARHADWLVALDSGRLAACGPPSDVLDRALIRNLYGVDSYVLLAPDGSPIAVPVRPADWPLPVPRPLPQRGAASVKPTTRVPELDAERRLVRLFAVLQFTLLLDYMVLMPLGAALMSDFDIGPAQFGWVVGVYTLASASASLAGGRLLDRGDRKRSMLLLYAGFVVATLACGLADGFGVLLAARALTGACAGLLSASMMALIADRIAPERRGQAIGGVMSAFGICAVIGVPSGLWLASLGGWRVPFFAVAALASGWWLILRRALPAAPAAAGGANTGLFTPSLALGWLLSFGIVFAGFLIVPYLGAHLNGSLGVTLQELSGLYLGAGLATFAAARAVGRAADRYGAGRVLAGLMLASIVPHLWLTGLDTVPLPHTALAFTLFMVVTSTRAIPASAWLVGRVPPPLRGRYLAINTASTEAASGLAALCGGMMTTGATGGLYRFERVGWLAAGVTLLTLGLLFWLSRQSGTSRPGAMAASAASQSSSVGEVAE